MSAPSTPVPGIFSAGQLTVAMVLARVLPYGQRRGQTIGEVIATADGCAYLERLRDALEHRDKGTDLSLTDTHLLVALRAMPLRALAEYIAHV